MPRNRGAASRVAMTASFWKHCIFSLFTVSPGELCPGITASGTASGSGSGGSAGPVYSRRFSNCLPRPARPCIWFRCSTARWYEPTCLPPAQKQQNPRSGVRATDSRAKSNRAACRARGIVPVIPYRSNVKDRPKFFPKLLYRTRARVEQAIGKLKRFKRVAMRCEKTKASYDAFVCFACTMILVKSVHRA